VVDLAIALFAVSFIIASSPCWGIGGGVLFVPCRQLFPFPSRFRAWRRAAVALSGRWLPGRLLRTGMANLRLVMRWRSRAQSPRWREL